MLADFAEAVAMERLPEDVREAAPTLLWTLHMGILLYFLYDDSANQVRHCFNRSGLCGRPSSRSISNKVANEWLSRSSAT